MSNQKDQYSIGELMHQLERRAPSATAESYDNVGLLMGDPATKTSGVVASVDLTAEALKTAISKKYKLIVTHHPVIFPGHRGISRLVKGKKRDDLSTLMVEALKNDVSVACCHTNFDQCALEVVQKISDGLGVKPLGRLIPRAKMGDPQSLLKLAVYVPEDHTEKVRSAICEAGAGQIGQYDFCTFATAGTGTFRGLDGADPFVGKAGQLESAQELRLEVVVPRGLKAAVLSALMKAHPYDEVAYDLFPVEQQALPKGLARGVGYGFWGEFESPQGFDEVAERIKKTFSAKGFLMTQPKPEKIKRMAWSPGSGGSFAMAAQAQKCDLFVTGEAGYHEALTCSRRGMAVLELGHQNSEYFFPEVIADWFKELGLGAEIVREPTQVFV